MSTAPARTDAPADWTEQASLYQPRQLAFWLYALLLVVGLRFIVDENAAFFGYSPTLWLIAIVLLGLYALPVYLLVNALDLFEREPRSLLIAAFLWGGTTAGFFASQINTNWDVILTGLFGKAFDQAWGGLTAPFIEEPLKALGVVVIYLIARHEFDDPMDGLVYGALVGLGFAVSENMAYFFGHDFIRNPQLEPAAGLASGFFLRVVVGGPYMHVIWSGLTGYALGYWFTRLDVPRPRRLRMAAGIAAVGVAAHLVWNSRLLNADLLGPKPDSGDFLVWAFVKGSPFLLVLALAIRRLMRREAGWIRQALASEVDARVVTAAELDALAGMRTRRAARAAAQHQSGRVGAQLTARLQHAEIALGLALVGGEASTATANLHRDRIRALRAELAALPRVDPVSAGGRQVLTATIAPTPFTPTAAAPADGLSSWPIPDGRGAPTPIAGGLPLEVVQRVQDWAQVRASNGWTGWVDARRLATTSPVASSG